MATSKFKSNKSNDLLIIKELEKEWGIKLKKYTSSRWKRQNGYYYINNKIIGFAFSGGMKYLPKSLSSLKNLEFLFLEGNRLTDISSLKNLKKLKELDLSHNTINDISPLKNLDSLAKLYLYENSIENLTPLSKLRNLEILDAAHNSISDISSLSKLTKLKKLELNHNSIIDISSVENLSKLEVLNLWNNQIRDLSSLHKLTNLENIDLFSNHINDISALKELKKLIKLDLGSNEITEITELKDLRNLKTLHLWKNNIKDISILSHLRNLTELKISYCKLTDISPLKDLKELKMLDLANNNLIYFPAWLLETQMENSSGDTYGIIESGFCLVDNPIENVPAELLQENKSVIGDYFKSLEYGSQAINEIKVILLGEGAAGKTSLMNYLQGKPFNKEEPQTHGINLEECTGLSGVTMKVWDFGGQDIMHHTHQFFLTKKSVYVIVLNARENTDTEKWLKLVQVFGGDSPVIILTNKIDENPSAHENIKYLNTKYNNLNNRYLRISVEKGTGLKEFKSLLTETITELLHVRTLWANSWLGVKKELEEMRSGESLKDYIHFEKYEEICNKNGVFKSHQDTLINWLNRLGIITYFPDSNLNETNVINPSWLTEAFYSIINSKKVAENFGRFNSDQLNNILDNKRYPKHKYSFLLGLMTKFELCYKIDETYFLIPDLLSKEEPEFSFNILPSLKFKYKYSNLLPKAILPKFMVRRHKEISNDKKWRTGLLIADPYFECEALVRIDEADKEIYIYVNGQEKRGYLAGIISNLEDINKIYEGLEYKKEVPCCCDICKKSVKPYYHEYDVLINSRKRGRKDYICKQSDADVSIDELLGVLITREELEKQITTLLGKGTFKTKKYLEEGNVVDFIGTLKILFSSVSYLLFEKNEKAYHTPLFILLRSIFNSNARADEIQAKGRTDVIIDLEKYIYILELKLDQSSEEALQQIHENKYYEPYLLEDKKIILIGINFSSKSRNISDFKVENYK